MRDTYDGQTHSAMTSPVGYALNHSGGSTPLSLPSPGGAYAPLTTPNSIGSVSSGAQSPALRIDTAVQPTSPTSPGMQHVQPPIVPDRMIVEGREQDSGMSFEELAAPAAAVSLPPSYEQASERPRGAGQ